MSYEIEFTSSDETLAARAPEWERLAAEAVEPNVFYEPWMFLPAWRLFPRPESAGVLFVFERAGSSRTLRGVFPFVGDRHHRLLPLPRWSLFRYYYCSLCTPLVSRENTVRVIEEALRWALEQSSPGYAAFSFINADGTFRSALAAASSSIDGLYCPERRIDRALLVRNASAEEYLSAALSGKKRKDLRRLERRLSEIGKLTFVRLDHGRAPSDSIDEFLRLELSGWKGRSGTAFAATTGGSEFFHTILAEAGARDRLRLSALRLDGRLVAGFCVLTAGDGAYAFRISFDESYAKFSPGTLLAIKDLEHLHREPGITWMDSCAAPQHSLADALWRERRSIVDARFARGGSVGAFTLMAESTARSIVHGLQQICRRLVPPAKEQHE